VKAEPGPDAQVETPSKKWCDRFGNMANTPEVPAWLLNDLFMTDGAFNEARTEVTGRPNPHATSVLDTGKGRPSHVTVRLKEDQKRRLEEELMK